MTAKETARALRGRRIVRVEMRPFSTGVRLNPWSYAPRLTLDDGTLVTFSVDETEIGEYGISVNVHPKA